MAHSGYDFARRSYHTLNQTVCPRFMYLAQILGVERRERATVDEGPLARGRVFHTLMEVFYTPACHRDKPLKGTDGNPVLRTPEEVLNWYEDSVSPKTLDEAWTGWLKYQMHRGEDEELKSRVIGRPEPDVMGDIRTIMPPSMARRYADANGRYSAQLDLAVRHKRRKAVVIVEHKLLAFMAPKTLALYQNSGQLVGQAAIWNSRADLVEKFGPVDTVLLNLTFDTKQHTVHREDIAIPVAWQANYAAVVCQANREIDQRLAAYEKAALLKRPAATVGRIWPQLGIVRGHCTGIISSCRFVDACRIGSIEPELYQITERGKERAARDGVVHVAPQVKTYANPNL